MKIKMVYGFYFVMLSMCFIAFPARANVFGISPGTEILYVTPDNPVTESVTVMRSSPTDEGKMDVTVGGDVPSAIKLNQGGGATLVFDVGQKSVEYTFTIDASRLEIGKTYNDTVSFIEKKDVNNIDEKKGNGIKFGVAETIKFHVVSQIEQKAMPIDVSLQKTFLKDVIVKNEKIEHIKRDISVSFDIKNNGNDEIINIPYSIEIYKKNIIIGASKGRYSTVIEPNQSATVKVSLNMQSYGDYVATLHLGDIKIEKRFSTRESLHDFFIREIKQPIFYVLLFSFAFILIVFGICFRKKYRNFLWLRFFGVITVLVAATVFLINVKLNTPLQESNYSSVAMNGQFILVQNTTEKTQTLYNLENGLSQGMTGLWNVFVTDNHHVVFFPNDNSERDRTKESFFVFNSEGIAPFSNSVFPGKVDFVTASPKNMYMLFTGKNYSGKQFICFLDVFETKPPDCNIFDSIMKSKTNNIFFDTKADQIIDFITDNGESFKYDLWKKEKSLLSNISNISKITYSKSRPVFNHAFQPDVFGIKTFGFTHSVFSLHSEFVQLSNTLILENEQKYGISSIYLLNIKQNKKAFIAKLNKGDQVYFLEKGDFITSP